MAYAPRVRINPPLILRESEVDEALSIFDDSFREVEGRERHVASA